MSAPAAVLADVARFQGDVGAALAVLSGPALTARLTALLDALPRPVFAYVWDDAQVVGQIAAAIAAYEDGEADDAAVWAVADAALNGLTP